MSTEALSSDDEYGSDRDRESEHDTDSDYDPSADSGDEEASSARRKSKRQKVARFPTPEDVFEDFMQEILESFEYAWKRNLAHKRCFGRINPEIQPLLDALVRMGADKLNNDNQYFGMPGYTYCVVL